MITRLSAIIIPVYNGEEFIATTLNSCLDQTLLAPIIVVDDQSSDKTINIVRDYQHKFPGRIKLSINKRRYGRVGCWNRCLEIFEALPYKYLKYVFAGDEILPDCIKEFEKAFSIDKNIGAVASAYEFVRPDGETSYSWHKEFQDRVITSQKATRFNLEQDGLLGAMVCHAYNKKFIKGMKFTEYLITKLDFDTILLSKSKAYYIGKVLSRFNLDSHRTFAKSISTWCNLEFSYVEARMLDQLKDMFTPIEYTQLKKQIVMNSIKNQYRFFGSKFLLDIIIATFLEIVQRFSVTYPRFWLKHVFKIG